MDVQEPQESDAVSKVERTKAASAHLRGTIAAELEEATPTFTEEAGTLLKFHGVYQQDDRDRRNSLAARLAGVLGAERPAALIANATLPSQRVARGRLCDIAALANSEGIESPATLVVGEVVQAVPLRQSAPGWVPAARAQSSAAAAGR